MGRGPGGQAEGAASAPRKAPLQTQPRELGTPRGVLEAPRPAPHRAVIRINPRIKWEAGSLQVPLNSRVELIITSNENPYCLIFQAHPIPVSHLRSESRRGLAGGLPAPPGSPGTPCREGLPGQGSEAHGGYRDSGGRGALGRSRGLHRLGNPRQIKASTRAERCPAGKAGFGGQNRETMRSGAWLGRQGLGGRTERLRRCRERPGPRCGGPDAG